MKLKTTAVVQARMGSTRLPGKVLKDLFGKPVIQFLLERLNKSQLINEIIIATSTDKEDDTLVDFLNKKNYRFIRGDNQDVLSRYALAAKSTNSDAIMRITGDCPLIDPDLIDEIIEEFYSLDSDYHSNCYPPTYPDGLDVEIFKKRILFEAHKNAKAPSEREHVTPWIRNCGLYKITTKKNPINLSNKRWTLDEEEDLTVIRKVIKSFNLNNNFSWEDILLLQNKEPHLFENNKKFKRNEGFNLPEGQKLWKRAKKVIPGGNMLLSKRSELFLPEYWPTYFSKAKGCIVWDLKGNEFIDMNLMGVGTNTLAYGNEVVDQAVSDVIRLGNLSSLNCPEEVYLAEKLIELHPWAHKVRFARTGGEANSIAVRIARAATNRDKIAICGYHGWHDWYLATNINNKNNLKEHLLPGLNPTGVPKNLEGTVLPFSYNNFDQLIKITNDHDLAAIKMEVERSNPPKDDFLRKVRDLCNKKNIILIFDECTSGFRETYGGLHKKYNINPDISIFGKALGNGYAITSIIGKESIMDSAQKTFISSTFWTERIGPTAALACLEVMKEMKSWEIISQKGKSIKEKWRNLAKENELDITITGIDALPGFSFNSNKKLLYKTYITQEMLKRGYLASTAIYLSVAHKDDIIDNYFENLSQIFKEIALFEKNKIDDFLDGPPCHSGFERLN